MEFKDHFSGRAKLYAAFRPTYPDPLFEWLAALAAERELVWDCATGSGQAATGLARYFKRVIAIDASEKQIGMAKPHKSIEYRIASAYDSGLPDASVDAVTVAQAIHWLDTERFYAEARRVMKPDAFIAVWAYGDPVLEDPVLDQIVREYNRGTIERYWKPERFTILGGLREIPFPFREVAAPEFTMQREWSVEEIAGYMRTWSATAAYAEAHGGDPVAPVEEALRREWPGGRQRVTWPLFVRAGFL